MIDNSVTNEAEEGEECEIHEEEEEAECTEGTSSIYELVESINFFNKGIDLPIELDHKYTFVNGESVRVKLHYVDQNKSYCQFLHGIDQDKGICTFLFMFPLLTFS